jgi:hypothetical protein
MLSAEAEVGDNGGTRRVLTRPGRGAFAITAIAHPPLRDVGPSITTRHTQSSSLRWTAQAPARGHAHWSIDALGFCSTGVERRSHRIESGGEILAAEADTKPVRRRRQ